MRLWTGVFAAVLLGTASQSQAQLSGWCSGTAKDQSTYVTPVINLPRTSTEDRASNEDRFQEWLESKTGKSIGIADCYGYESRAEADTEHAADLQHKYGSGVNVTLIDGFTLPGSSVDSASSSGAKSAASSEPRATTSAGGDAAHKPTGSGPYLTVKTDTSLIDARKKQEALELQAQRDEAASIAKRVADAARSRADMQAKMANLFAEMRKRGSAQ